MNCRKQKERYNNANQRIEWIYTIAAAVIILIPVGIYIYQSNSNRNHTTSVAVTKQDIMPGSDMATLRLANGKQIELKNDGADTSINNQVNLLRKDGQLVYSYDAATKELVQCFLTRILIDRGI